MGPAVRCARNRCEHWRDAAGWQRRPDRGEPGRSVGSTPSAGGRVRSSDPGGACGSNLPRLTQERGYRAIAMCRFSHALVSADPAICAVEPVLLQHE